MKFSTALTSIILTSCSLAGVRASPAALSAHYCLVNPDTCVDVDPVPIEVCVEMQQPGMVKSFVANVDCVLFNDLSCDPRGPLRIMRRGQLDHPNLYGRSFLCFPL